MPRKTSGIDRLRNVDHLVPLVVIRNELISISIYMYLVGVEEGRFGYILEGDIARGGRSLENELNQAKQCNLLLQLLHVCL